MQREGSQTVYLLHEGSGNGLYNMAMDQALLKRCGETGDCFLRFYSWNPATLSLGYFQKPADVCELQACRDAGVQLVRRQTGGGAILHDREITFSMVFPENHPVLGESIPQSYFNLTRPLLEYLQQRGVDTDFRGAEKTVCKTPNCFAGSAATDLVLEGRKVFGSAQRRKSGAVMTHGSLLLDIDRQLWQNVFGDRMGSGFTSLKDYGITVDDRRSFEQEIVTAYQNFMDWTLREFGDSLSWQEQAALFRVDA